MSAGPYREGQKAVAARGGKFTPRSNHCVSPICGHVSQTVSCLSTALQSFRVLSEAVQHIDGQSVRDLEKRVLDDPTDEAAQVMCVASVVG